VRDKCSSGQAGVQVILGHAGQLWLLSDNDRTVEKHRHLGGFGPALSAFRNTHNWVRAWHRMRMGVCHSFQAVVDTRPTTGCPAPACTLMRRR
jgi:hypothetical protein